jgi:YidC/Oxa1 family membrane protein insertase
LAEFSNPNQQGGQDNRSLVMMMLVLGAVFFGLQIYHAKYAPPTAPPSAPGAAAQSPAASTAAPAAITAVPQAAGAKPTTPAIPVVAAPAESTTVIENELYRIAFTNRGAQVVSWVLKCNDARKDLPCYRDSNGKPLDLVHQQAAEKFGYPLSLYTYEAATTAALNKALFVPSATGALTAPATLTFKYSDGNIQATKTFTFDETYLLHADVQVTQAGVPIRALLAWPGGFGDQDNATAYNSTQVDTSTDGKEQHLAVKKVSGGNTLNGPFDWAGVSDPYFAAIFLPDDPSAAVVATLHNDLDVAKTIKRTGFTSGTASNGTLMVPILGAAVGSISGNDSLRIYAGPKAVNVLKNIHAANPSVTLEPLLNFGFWGPVGKVLFLALQLIHAHIVAGWSGSWGWSIVILTIGINLLILPFRIKTMQSALKMQRIQPQMDAIKEKYKKYKVTDPKRNEMNAEVLQLQKDNGVNMFGGCIPTLITFPLLIAFFGMLTNVVELRQAHWLWLPDLSLPDPYHILPIFMFVSMFLVQFYTPSPGVDPQQQKMMAFMMPVFSLFWTWSYASGLALYWATGNVISVAQQAVMNQTRLGREMREIAAKRARRKAATIQGRK